MRYEIKKVHEGNWKLYMNEQLVKSDTTLYDIIATIREMETHANVEYKEG